MFFKGNHRPHNKEDSKGELKFLLNKTGFEIERHEYFDRMQGEFSILNNKYINKYTISSKLAKDKITIYKR